MTADLVDTRTGEIHSGDLLQLVRAERMLAEASTAQEFLQIEDLAEAARVFAKQMGLGVSSINHATVIKVCAAIGLAEAVTAGQAAGVIATRGGNQSNPRSAGIATLPDLKIDSQRLAEARKLKAKHTPGEIRELSAELTAAGKELSRRQLLNGEAVQQSLTNEWYTPARYINAARTVLGGIDLDPASCDEANETVRATCHYSADGLKSDWHGRVWLNPPYGRLAGTFVQRLVDQYDAGNVTAAVALVNAHCTDTAWFQPLWDHTLCFTDHRIDFAAGTEARSGSTHGSVFAYLGRDRALFAETFAPFGAVVTRWAA